MKQKTTTRQGVLPGQNIPLMPDSFWRKRPPGKRRYDLDEAFVRARFLPVMAFVAATNAFPQTAVRPAGAPMHGQQRRAFSNFFPWFFGGDYGYETYASAPSVVMVLQPPTYVAAPAGPVAPPKAEMHEYSHPSAGVSDSGQTFAIVLKDGSVLSAIAVTSQVNGLYYVDPEGGHRLVRLDVLDREATTRLNRERKLQLQLPAAQ